jgi:uncharacterized protein YndB with AHSA1/START domain
MPAKKSKAKPTSKPRSKTSATKTGTIRQTVWLPGTPAAVYAALMTTKGHKGFSGADARISPRVGGTFMAWDGYIHGKNLTLVEDELIEQTWWPSEETWPKGHVSTVRFALAPSQGGTRLTFVHSEVPREHVGHLSGGWKKSYWDPLKRYLKAPAK